MLFYILAVGIFTCVAGSPFTIDLQQNCGAEVLINQTVNPNGFIIVKDLGVEELTCKVTIKCDENSVIDMRLFEVNFPSCSQSEFSVISVLGPTEADHYPTFNTYPHFCGQKFTPDVVLEQSGEKEWQFILNTKPEKVFSFAKLAFSAHPPDVEPIWPLESTKPPYFSTTKQEGPDVTKVTRHGLSSEPTLHNASNKTASLTNTTLSALAEILTKSSSNQPSDMASSASPFSKYDTSSTRSSVTQEQTTPETSTNSAAVKSTASSTTISFTTGEYISTSKSISVTATFPKEVSTKKETVATTTTTRKLTFRCHCPISLSTSNKIQMQGSPILNSSFYFDINPISTSSRCYSPEIAMECQQRCGEFASLKFGKQGPLATINFSSNGNLSTLLGDAVCSRSVQDYPTAMLTMHIHIAGCPGKEISLNPVVILDEKFSCYSKRFCSLNYYRPPADNLMCPTTTQKMTTPRTTPKTMSTILPNRCTCTLGVYKETLGLIKNVELTGIVPPLMLDDWSCSVDLEDCEHYCEEQVLLRGAASFLSFPVNNKRLVDLPCDGSNPILAGPNLLYVNARVSTCSEGIFFPVQKKNMVSPAVLLARSFCCNGESSVPCYPRDTLG